MLDSKTCSLLVELERPDILTRASDLQEYRRLGPALEGMHWQGAIANILRDFLFERDKRFDIPV